MYYIIPGEIYPTLPILNYPREKMFPGLHTVLSKKAISRPRYCIFPEKTGRALNKPEILNFSYSSVPKIGLNL